MLGALLQRSRRTRAGQGNQLIEFAMVLPVLLMMFLGVFDFGWILHQQIALDNATREGARRGAVGANNANINSTMQSMVSFPINTSNVTVTVINSAGVTQANTSRNPDDTIIVRLQRNNVELITPIRALVDSIGTINLVSEARFIIE